MFLSHQINLRFNIWLEYFQIEVYFWRDTWFVFENTKPLDFFLISSFKDAIFKNSQNLKAGSV